MNCRLWVFATAVTALCVPALAGTVHAASTPRLKLDACPKTQQAAQKLLSGLPVTKRKNRPHDYVEYDVRGVLVLGAQPLKLTAEMYDQRLVGIEAELPLGADYSPAFEKAFAGAKPECDDSGCITASVENPSIGELDDAGLEVVDESVIYNCGYDY